MPQHRGDLKRVSRWYLFRAAAKAGLCATSAALTTRRYLLINPLEAGLAQRCQLARGEGISRRHNVVIDARLLGVMEPVAGKLPLLLVGLLAGEEGRHAARWQLRFGGVLGMRAWAKPAAAGHGQQARGSMCGRSPPRGLTTAYMTMLPLPVLRARASSTPRDSWGQRAPVASCGVLVPPAPASIICCKDFAWSRGSNAPASCVAVACRNPRRAPAAAAWPPPPLPLCRSCASRTASEVGVMS